MCRRQSLALNSRVYKGKYLKNFEIYNQYVRKNLDLLEQGPGNRGHEELVGNDDVSIVRARK